MSFSREWGFIKRQTRRRYVACLPIFIIIHCILTSISTILHSTIEHAGTRHHMEGPWLKCLISVPSGFLPLSLHVQLCLHLCLKSVIQPSSRGERISYSKQSYSIFTRHVLRLQYPVNIKSNDDWTKF